MSYILEALKKAQAERQIGSAPTIHAPQALPASAAPAGASRKPLLIGLAAGALVVAVGGALAWRALSGPAAPTAAPVGPPATAPAQRPATAPAAPTLAVTAPAPAPRLAPAVPVPPPRAPEPAHARAPVGEPAARVPAPQRQPVQSPAPVPAPVAAAPGADDSLPWLQQLPEGTQREIPRVSFGGYMYSANPADRLLLVDKALRHEGEEVAPGLVLEKLLPKAAVMNFRGTRYRVPY